MVVANVYGTFLRNSGELSCISEFSFRLWYHNCLGHFLCSGECLCGLYIVVNRLVV